jgi:periplasmic protein TonB
MADGSLRSVDPPGMSPERHTRLKVVESGPEEAPHGPSFAAAVPARIVLSEASDLWGISPSGWVAALFLFGAVASGALFAWRVAPPPAWPSDPVLVRLVFEEPALPAPETMAAPTPSEPASTPPVAPPETPPPAPVQEAATTEVEPEPPPIATHPTVTPLPKPPSRKPALRHAEAPSPPATPSPAEGGSAPSAATQTAALPAATTSGVRSSVLQPSLEHGAKPAYPAAAQLRGLQGRVLLRIDVAASGALADAAVITSSGHAILDKAALAWIRVQRFRPAMRDGKAVDGEVDLPVEFRLED